MNIILYITEFVICSLFFCFFFVCLFVFEYVSLFKFEERLLEEILSTSLSDYNINDG